MKQCFRNVVILVMTCASVFASEKPYGPLPSGALSISEVSEVPAEICRDHLFDPGAFALRLPLGYRLTSAEDYAKDDRVLADFLRANPTYARFAVGSLCFMAVGKFTVDGVRVNPPGATPMAFWWARAEGPRDLRMQGKSQWLQLASWYSRDITERAKVLATDPMAQFTDIQVSEMESGVWRLRLELTDEVVEGEVRCSGELTRRTGTPENFMSVPFSGESAGYFWVISYFGHHQRPAQGEWKSKGSGIFSSAFQMPDESKVFSTGFQNGWSALSGLYRAR